MVSASTMIMAALVSLVLGGLNALPVAAALEEGPVLLTPRVDIPVGVVGYGVDFELFTKTDVPAVFAIIRASQPSSGLEQGTDQVAEIVVATERLEHGRVQTATMVTLGADLEPGDYRVSPCVGFYPHSCTELVGGGVFQIVSPEIRELLPGHNRPGAQRINVLFVGSGGVDVSRTARRLLTLDGPVLTGTDLLYGPMAIEPLRSNGDKFNFWFLPVELKSELGLVADAGDLAVLDAFGLPNLQVTALYRESGGLSDARTTSFFGQRELPRASDLHFGGVRVVVPEGEPMLAAPTLAHEWGHGLFELRDEYYGFDGRPVLNRYPNCAPDATTAQSWWGSQLGRVDPFVYEVLQARTDAGLPTDTYDQPLPEMVRIGIISGGCYGLESGEGSFRPSFDSLMNSELPVFGSVNRARAEEVLSRFSGRGVLESTDDLTLSCTSRAERFTCEGQLRSYVDPPAAGLEVAGQPCGFDSELEPIRVSCGGPMPAGNHVTVSIGLSRSRVEVVNLDPPVPTSLATSGLTPTEQEAFLAAADASTHADELSVPQQTMARFWLVLGTTAVTAAALVGGARRLRRP